MYSNKRIAIILTDTLQSLGLQSLLMEYFPPAEVCYFSSFQEFSSKNDTFDFYFIQPDTYILNADFFLPRRSKTVTLISYSQPDTSSYNELTLNIHSTPESIIEQLEKLLVNETINGTSIDGNKGLSAREIDVLQLIVKGSTNKEIADKLNISLNTVLTHRKNITSKLGIKTVSGLTFYAIMNGLISGDDIEL